METLLILVLPAQVSLDLENGEYIIANAFVGPQTIINFFIVDHVRFYDLPIVKFILFMFSSMSFAK